MNKNDDLIGEIENNGKYTLGSVSDVWLYTGTGTVHDSGMAADDLRYSFSSLINFCFTVQFYVTIILRHDCLYLIYEEDERSGCKKELLTVF